MMRSLCLLLLCVSAAVSAAANTLVGLRVVSFGPAARMRVETSGGSFIGEVFCPSGGSAQLVAESVFEDQNLRVVYVTRGNPTIFEGVADLARPMIEVATYWPVSGNQEFRVRTAPLVGYSSGESSGSALPFADQVSWWIKGFGAFLVLAVPAIVIRKARSASQILDDNGGDA